MANVLQSAVVIWELMELVLQPTKPAQIAYGVAFSALGLAFASASCQIFMAFRCWKLAKRSVILAIVLSLLVVATFVEGVTVFGIIRECLCQKVVVERPIIATAV